MKQQVSPRMGLSFPMMWNMVVVMNYGHYFQFPLFDYLYSGINPQQLRSGVSVLVGNPDLKQESLTEIYRTSDIFMRLRDTANLKGKCAICEFRELCGGSRSRAWAALGDAFASDPTCTYQPRLAVAG